MLKIVMQNEPEEFKAALTMQDNRGDNTQHESAKSFREGRIEMVDIAK